MLERFKQLSKQKKWLVGIIAILVFPITIMLIAAELAINGFKQGRIFKLILGSLALLVVTSMIWTDSSTVPRNLYDEQTVELDETASELNNTVSKLKKANNELKDKSKTIDEAKVYLELSEEEKGKVSEFISQMKNSQNASDEDKKENSSEEAKNDTSNTNKESTSKSNGGSSSNSSNNYSNRVNSSSNNSSSGSETAGRIVYANGGSSTSNKYHSSPTAHNMEGAIKMSESKAKSRGYVPCQRCY